MARPLHKIVFKFRDTEAFSKAADIARKILADTATPEDYRAFREACKSGSVELLLKRDARRGKFGPKEPICLCGHHRSLHYKNHGTCCGLLPGQPDQCLCKRYRPPTSKPQPARP